MRWMRAAEPKKEPYPQEDSTRPGWEVIYTGFILILLSFFILLSSFATMEESKIARFVKSFVEAVSVLDGGLSFESGEEIVTSSADMVDVGSELARILEELELFTSTYGYKEEVGIHMTAEGVVMRLSDRALFDLGAAEISSSARPLLNKIGALIAQSSVSVRIEGHSDNLPIRTERYPSNWELSTTRAVNVLRYLITDFNISAARMSAAGYGEYRPIVPNKSARQRARNRRVEIVFLNGK